MDPVLISIGPLAIRWYGLLIALGVLAGSVWGVREARRRGMDADAIVDAAPWMVLAGLVGARLVYVVTSPDAFFGPGGRPLDAFAVWQGGISIHGSIVGVLLAVWWFAPRKGMKPWAVMDVLTPVGAFGIIGGRIGNLMNGTDTGGRLTSWSIGVAWPERGTETFGAVGRWIFGSDLWAYSPPVCSTVPAGDPCIVHLTPVYGMVVGILLIPWLAWAFRTSRRPGVVFAWFVLGYSLLRSLLEEPFRDNPLFFGVYLDPVGGVGVFTLTQLVSIPLIAIAAYGLFVLPGDDDKRSKLVRRAARSR